jgi:hypothetical protein
MANLERSARKDSPLFIHTSGRLISENDLTTLRRTAANVGLNLKVIAASGEKYTPIQTSSRRIKDIEANPTEPLDPEVTPDGQVYISLTRFNLNARDFTLERFDEEVVLLEEKHTTLEG